jgi:hypothetical protein
VGKIVARGHRTRFGPDYLARAMKKVLLWWMASWIPLLLSAQGESVLPYTMLVTGTVTGEMAGDPLKGVKVRVLRDGDLSNLLITKGNGRFEVELERDYFYKMEFTRDGLVDKHVTIDTHGAPPLLDVPSITMHIDITLFTPVEELDNELFNEPMGRAVYKHSVRNIEWDREYEKEVTPKLRRFMAQYYKAVEERLGKGTPERPEQWPPQ